MHTILLIEDNSNIRENTIEILEMAGYIVITACDGKDGIDHAVLHKPDLIICDILMPEMDGFGVLEALRKEENTAAIPFIFMTAQAEKPSIARGLKTGAHAYLIKPLDPQLMLGVIKEQLNLANSAK